MKYLPVHFEQKEKEFILDLFHDFEIKNINKLYLAQYGGDQISYHKYINEGGLHTFKVNEDNSDKNRLQITILSEDEKECVTIFIQYAEKNAILHNMSYYKDCALEGLRKPGGGNKLFKFAVNLILKYQSQYEIKRILLRDNSFIYCQCSETLKLAQLRIITDGETWYSKYGFKPFDARNNRYVLELLGSMRKSAKIFESFQTNEIDLDRTIDQIERMEGIKIDKANVLSISGKYPLFRNFIFRLLKEFDKYCCLITYLLKLIYNPESKTGLVDFYGKVFALDI